jgi:hypothetical protein
VLAAVEWLERAAHPLLDRVASRQGHAEVGGGVGYEHVVEGIPVLRVERPAVGDRHVDDRESVVEVGLGRHQRRNLP